MTYTFPELLLSLSLAVYLSVCVMVAVIRRGHNPAWRTLVGCALSYLALIPVLFLPGDPDALLLLRVMLLLSSPFLCSVLLFSYFGRVLKVAWWRKPTWLMAASYAAMVLLALVTTLIPGTQMQGAFRNWYFLVAAVLAAGYLLALVFAINLMLQPLGKFSEEAFSNPDDFPEQYVKSLVYVPFLHLILSWSITFNGSYPALAIGLFLLAVLYVIILLGALSPRSTVEVKRVEREVAASEENEIAPENLSPERKEEILNVIRRQVEQEQAYLDNHLTLSKLSQSCGFNRTYVSAVLNEKLGGFFQYINRCRLSHADAYKAEHPRADVDEVATLSGFNSRQSYYNARRRG